MKDQPDLFDALESKSVVSASPEATIPTEAPPPEPSLPPRPDRPPWQLLEPEYIDWFADCWLCTLGKRRRLRPSDQTWLADIQGRSERFLQAARKEYRKVIKEAMRQRQPIPPTVLEQAPDLGKMRDDYASYLKGWNTSFANHSAAVDASMKAMRGCKVKRQDGQVITDTQKAEIACCLDEVETVLGSLRDILDRVDVTIAHTSGKHPFLSRFGGLYHTEERSLSIGIEDRLGRPIRAFAHEMAHMFDAEAGRVSGLKPGSRQTGVYLSEHANGNTGAADASEADLLRKALQSMSERSNLDRLLKQTQKDALTEVEKAEIERRQVHLGRYWRRPCEVFARLVEQYISTTLGERGGTAAERDYTGRAGWWAESAFLVLAEDVRRCIDRRLQLLRLEK